MQHNDVVVGLPSGFVDRCREAVGDAALLTDPADTATYATDFWHQYGGATPLVVRPGSAAEVASIVRLAAEHGVPIVPQAGNTGLVGGGVPDASGREVVLSLNRMARIRHVDPTGDHLIVDAGCILQDVQAKAAEIGRYFPLSLGAEGTCRIGGNLATNAGGVNVLRYGMVRDLVLGIEVVTADGEIWDGLRALRKDNTGYDLKQLFIGSEGTLGIITGAALRLVAAPRERQTLWLSVETPAAALQLFELFQRELGELISSFELITSIGVEAAVEHLDVRRPLAEPQPWHVLIEISWSFEDGLAERCDTVVEQAFEAGLVLDGTIAQNEAQRAAMWRIREGQSEATRHLGYIVRSDVTVPVARMAELIERITAWTAREAPDVVLLPFGHVGDGNLHANFITPPDRVELLRPAMLGALYDMVTEMRGAISAEHGIGRLKRAAMAARKPATELAMQRKLKALFDPKGILNPGVVLDEET